MTLIECDIMYINDQYISENPSTFVKIMDQNVHVITICYKLDYIDCCFEELKDTKPEN
jgi:hypothetical protein